MPRILWATALLMLLVTEVINPVVRLKISERAIFSPIHSPTPMKKSPTFCERVS
jgi:hypothetical protein